MSGTISASVSPVVTNEFNTSQLAPNDDGATPAVALGFSADFFGNTYSNVYVSNNGYVTFGQPSSTYTPTGLGASYDLGVPIIAAFFADVDTRNADSGILTYGTGTYAGHAAFGATWPAVGYYADHADKLDTFQIILVDRSDAGAGDFDIYFNYGSIQWETGDASGGTGGLGGTSAAVGYNAGTGAANTYEQLPGSLVPGAFLDGGPDALASSSNDGVTGQYAFQVRNGEVVTPLPTPVPTPVPTPLPTPVPTPVVPTPTPSAIIDFSTLNQNLILANQGLSGLAAVLNSLGSTPNPAQLTAARNAASAAATLASQAIPTDETNVQSALTAGQDLGSSATQLMTDVRQEATQLIAANTDALNAGASFTALSAVSQFLLTAAGNFIGMANSYQSSTGQGTSAEQSLTSAIAAFPTTGTDSTLSGGSQTALLVLDTSTSAAVPASGAAYAGPVADLQNQFIDITADSLNITAGTPGWFIHSGSGTDAISVASGSNVLDGGTGSNFLTGGSGTDTFFVDDRAPTADIWSTVNNMHAGDAATVWGVTPQDFALTWQDGQGAPGYTGLTLHATAADQPTASLTLAGYSTADLTNGRLVVSYGTDPVSGSTYMYIQAT